MFVIGRGQTHRVRNDLGRLLFAHFHHGADRNLELETERREDIELKPSPAH